MKHNTLNPFLIPSSSLLALLTLIGCNNDPDAEFRLAPEDAPRIQQSDTASENVEQQRIPGKLAD